jgi:hypothetical protein
MSLGVEKIEAVAESLKKLVIAGKKISEDKKVGLEDLGVIVALASEAPKIIESFSALGEAFAEVKDIDVAEAIQLIQIISKKIKEIEVA